MLLNSPHEGSRVGQIVLGLSWHDAIETKVVLSTAPVGLDQTAEIVVMPRTVPVATPFGS